MYLHSRNFKVEVMIYVVKTYIIITFLKWSKLWLGFYESRFLNCQSDLIKQKQWQLLLFITLFRSKTMFGETDNIYGVFFTFSLYTEIFCKILLVPHNIVMDLNNVMLLTLEIIWLTTPAALAPCGVKFELKVPARCGPVPIKFLGIIGQDPSDSKSNQLHVDIFPFWCFHLFEVYSIYSINSKMTSNLRSPELQPAHL